MDNIKFVLSLIVVLAIVGLSGYWAVTTIQSGSQHVNTLKIKQLESENENLKQQIAKLTTSPIQTEAEAAQPKTEVTSAAAQKPTETEAKTTTKTTTTKSTTTTYKNQTLINELQKLANAGIVLKLKSAGPSVGSVQKFLNVYNKTSNKIDNDYGASTKTAIATFQKAQGLTASGEAGKSTFTKMISWLKKQG